MAIALDETTPLNCDITGSDGLAGRAPPVSLSAETLASRLPRITKDAAHASRVLFDARVDALAARLAGIDAWQLRPVADAADDTTAPFDEPGRIVLTHVAGTLSIDVDLRRYPALQILASAGAANTGAAHSLRQSVATALLAPVTETMLEAGIGTWRVADVHRLTGASADVAADRLMVNLSVEVGGSRHDARAHASPAILTLLERRIASLQAGPTAPARPHAPHDENAFHEQAAKPHPLWRIPGRISIGARGIAIAKLEALRPGDVLLRTMPSRTETALSLGNPFRVAAAWGTPGLTRLAVAAEIDGTRLTIIETPIMTDELQYPEDGTSPFAGDLQGDAIEIGELDLPVQFELDSVALPLAQLSSLRAGYVIELETPVADAQIRLVAHGQTIGYGELISVAEHLGIRIVKMAHGDGSVQ